MNEELTEQVEMLYHFAKQLVGGLDPESWDEINAALDGARKDLLTFIQRNPLKVTRDPANRDWADVEKYSYKKLKNRISRVETELAILSESVTPEIRQSNFDTNEDEDDC